MINFNEDKHIELDKYEVHSLLKRNAKETKFTLTNQIKAFKMNKSIVYSQSSTSSTISPSIDEKIEFLSNSFENSMKNFRLLNVEFRNLKKEVISLKLNDKQKEILDNFDWGGKFGIEQYKKFKRTFFENLMNEIKKNEHLVQKKETIDKLKTLLNHNDETQKKFQFQQILYEFLFSF